MPEFHDKEFGDIVIRRNSSYSSMKVTVAPNGQLRISAPRMAPLFSIKRMVASSRNELRQLLESRPKMELHEGMAIGKSHRLRVQPGEVLSVKRTKQDLVVSLPEAMDLHSSEVVDLVRKQIITILRTEAKHYLPNQVSYLANRHGFSYKTLRFSHASTRWGSCSSAGTISLNIALMKLPFELIDYVILHELAHTKEMNHSPAFWRLVAEASPNYKAARAEIKKYSPGV